MPFQTIPNQQRQDPKLEKILAGIEATGKFVDGYLAGQEKKRKQEKDKIDAYITLRKAGYPDKASAEAVDKWDFSALRGVDRVSDLSSAKTKAEIRKIEGEIEYKKKMTENIGKGGGYEDPNDVPKMAGGLPVKSMKQDTKTGLWYGNYGNEKNSDSDDIWKNLKDPDKGAKASGSGENKGIFSSMMGKIFGTEEKIKKVEAKAEQVDTTEAMIKANMAHYGKSRAEVIAALKREGKI